MNIKISKKIHTDANYEKIHTLLLTNIAVCRLLKISPKKLTEFIYQSDKNEKYIDDCMNEAVAFLKKKKK
jgi:hypothetical protein